MERETTDSENQPNGSQSAEARSDYSWGDYFKNAGPAFLAGGLNIGSSSVTNAVLLASATGFVFGWVFFFATFAIYVTTLACVRITIVSKKDPIEVMSTEIHPVVGWANGVAILLVNFVFYTIQIPLGGAALNAIFPWLSVTGWSFLVVFMVAAIVLVPQLNFLERLLKYFLYGLIVVYLLSLFVVPVDWGAFFGGVFSFTPPTAQGDVLLFTAALGAALAINVPVVQAYASKAGGYSVQQLPLYRFETTLTNVMLLFVQFAVIIVVASTLFPEGIEVTSAAEAGIALEPIAGPLGTIVFSLGLLGAVITTMAVQTTVAGYVLSDLVKWRRDTASVHFKVVQIVLLLVGLLIPLFGLNPFGWVAWGAAFNSTFMPIGIATWWFLINRRSLMQNHVARRWMNVGLAVTLLIAIAAAARFWYVTLGG